MNLKEFKHQIDMTVSKTGILLNFGMLILLGLAELNFSELEAEALERNTTAENQIKSINKDIFGLNMSHLYGLKLQLGEESSP